MDIQGKDNIKFTLTGTDPLEEVFELKLFDEDTNEDLGSLKVKKTRYRAFVEMLREVMRASHGSFQAHEKATIVVDNKSEGTMRFE